MSDLSYRLIFQSFFGFESYRLEQMFLNRVGSILFYDGSYLDSTLNYAVLYLSLMAFVERGRCCSQNQRRLWPSWIALLFVYQIGLCLAVDCVGISIVWNALLAFSWHHTFVHKAKPVLKPFERHHLLIITTVIAVVVNLYYLFTEPWITTLAHILSWPLGWILSLLDRHISGKKCNNNDEDEAEGHANADAENNQLHSVPRRISSNNDNNNDTDDQMANHG